MSARTLTVEDLERVSGQALHSSNGATPGPEALCESLTDRLGLSDVHLKVIGATVWGRGADARVDIHLSGDARPLRFDRFGDISKPAALTTALMTQVAVGRMFKAPAAVTIGVEINKLASHYAEADEDEAAREWGAEYLRIAPTQEVDLANQAARWQAFSDLARMSPARTAGDDRSAAALATSSCVLVDHEDKTRLVRAGWFQAYVKREVGGLYSPAALATQMQRVGWKRPGSQGRIKATSPSEPRSHVWPFYVVARDWEIGAVIAGESTSARAGARARPLDTPAITDHRAHDSAPSNGDGHHGNGNGNGASR